MTSLKVCADPAVEKSIAAAKRSAGGANRRMFMKSPFASRASGDGQIGR
jgi:hypothetical protein